MIVPESPVEDYLAELASCLPATPARRDVVDEVRDHLLEAAAAYHTDGVPSQAAECQAVREFGAVQDLVRDFSDVIMVRDAQRQARHQLIVIGVLGTCGISVFRLVPLWLGQLSDIVPPPMVALIAAVVLLWPSFLLLVLSGNWRSWYAARWTTWLATVRPVVSWLFGLGVPVCAGAVTDQIATLLGISHAWLLAGVLGGILVSRRVAQVAQTSR